MTQAEAKRDIFDSLDLFDVIEPQRIKEYVAPPKVSISLTDEIRELIKSEIGSILREAVADAVKGIKPHTVETKVHERVIQKNVPTPEKIIIREKLDDAELHKTIGRKIKKAMDDLPLFVPAPPIIPNWSDKADGVILSKKASQLVWIPPPTGGGGGGTSSDVYTVSNVTVDRTYDANDTSLDELADVLGSLIASLQGAGIIQ